MKKTEHKSFEEFSLDLDHCVRDAIQTAVRQRLEHDPHYAICQSGELVLTLREDSTRVEEDQLMAD